MTTLNKTAAEVLPDFAVHACTDVTSFGLLGHAAEMAEGSQAGLTFHAAQIPTLAHSLDLAAKDLGGGSRDNQNFLEPKVTIADDADTLLGKLQQNSVAAAALIGEFTQDNPGRLLIKP